jgi:hypothetical protein
MSAEPPIPRDIWHQMTPAAQAAVLTLVESFERRIAAPEARLGQDSSNSSKPPSSDPIPVKRRHPRPPSGKGRGGQRGHKRHTPGLVPPELLTDVEGVPPHKNATERALRHGIIWRKTGYGTDGEAGGRFVERLLTVVATCRRRGRDALEFLTACLLARLEGTAAPSLLTDA